MIFINFDVETTGSNPAKHSMLSIGAVADVALHGHLHPANLHRLGEFSINLREEACGDWDPKTRAFWNLEENAEALRITTLNAEHPDLAMKKFVNWLQRMWSEALAVADPKTIEQWKTYWKADGFSSPFCFVASPVVFDMLWLSEYAYRYVETEWKEYGPASFSGFDLMTAAALVENRVPYLDKSAVHKEIMRPFYMPKHVAINDARAQAALFRYLLTQNDQLHRAYQLMVHQAL